MPHVYVVWTISDIFHAMVFGVIFLILAVVGLAFAYEGVKRWFKNLFANFLRGRR